MVASFTLILVFAFLASAKLFAIEMIELRQADKTALSLTGKPLSSELRAKYINREIDLKNIAAQLSKNEDFIEHFAQFWIAALRVQSIVDIYGFKVIDKRRQPLASFGNFPNLTNLTINQPISFSKEYLTDLVENKLKALPRLTVNGRFNCGDVPVLIWDTFESNMAVVKRAAETGIGYDDRPIPEGTQALYQKILEIYPLIHTRCDDPSLVLVHPWWDPIGVTTHTMYKNAPGYKTTPYLIERCGGPTLPLCHHITTGSFDRMSAFVNRDLVMEPGYIISHIAAEDRSFREILTSPYTILTGSYAYFLNHTAKDLWGNFPGKGFKDIAHQVFSPGSPTDRKHYWINRNELNAGVLTTPLFQSITNGRRAKANRAYETFLCRRFQVPEGAKADPTDANPDLTKRAYCAYCHKSLEPMAAFWNRWPDTGNINFEYSHADTINDVGRFEGKEGEGAAAFGKFLSESAAFDECSVRRAFEFVNGRKMNYVEMQNLLPRYVNEFIASQRSIRKVITEMVLAPDFLNPVKK